jgi:hypothetical protein
LCIRWWVVSQPIPQRFPSHVFARCFELSLARALWCSLFDWLARSPWYSQ